MARNDPLSLADMFDVMEIAGRSYAEPPFIHTAFVTNQLHKRLQEEFTYLWLDSEKSYGFCHYKPNKPGGTVEVHFGYVSEILWHHLLNFYEIREMVMPSYVSYERGGYMSYYDKSLTTFFPRFSILLDFPLPRLTSFKPGAPEYVFKGEL